jgi:ribosomal-protein-alanine N-acetyltransferase
MSDIFDHFPIITLDEIILRKISLEQDYADYFNYITSPHVTKYLPNDDIPDSLERAKIELNYWSRLFEYRSSFYWAIAKKDTNQIIGTCGFNYWNKTHKRAEISYDLDYNHWGKGIMTKAVKAISDFAFDSMGVIRIQATVALDNQPSIRVLEKVSYIRECKMSKYGILQGQPKDFYLYSLCN